MKISSRYTITGLVAVALLLAGSVLYAIDPAATPLLPTCPLHTLTGLYCPGCGSTRALHWLLHGDITRALAFNALLVISIPFLAVYTICPSWMRRPQVSWSVLAVIVAFGVARNLPWWPLTLLAPH